MGGDRIFIGREREREKKKGRGLYVNSNRLLSNL